METTIKEPANNSKTTRSPLRSRAGFMLMEILVTVTLLGTVAAIAAPKISLKFQETRQYANSVVKAFNQRDSQEEAYRQMLGEVPIMSKQSPAAAALPSSSRSSEKTHQVAKPVDSVQEEIPVETSSNFLTYLIASLGFAGIIYTIWRNEQKFHKI